MIETCRAYEMSDGAPEDVLAHAAARRFEQEDGRSARFRAQPLDGRRVRLTGAVQVAPPFGLVGSELRVVHAVVLDLSGVPEPSDTSL